MNITTGDIRNLVYLFHHKSSSYGFLCLFVAGHLRDAKFFQEILENKETLDTISGSPIAIFLFANEPIGVLDIEVRPGTVARLPGRPITNTSNGLWYQHIGKIRFDDEINKQVLQTSKVMAYQICEYFKLDVDDIPCILLLSKGNPEPFVILTKGERPTSKHSIPCLRI